VLERVVRRARRGRLPSLCAMRVKICGVTNIEDAEAAVGLGAWAIGLNHHPESPRFCAPDAAAQIGAAMRRRCEVAGVFVNASLDDIARAVENESLTLVQLHGDEGPDFCREVARRTGARVIKAFRVRSSAALQEAEAYRVDYHLMDAHRPGTPGGTGESFDWELLSARRSKVPMLLAGGLDPDNVATAIELTRPWGVDVASGVEAAPGRKDHDRLAAFFESARSATAAIR
jgi:phosphoribosylanthranilate isomerase